MVEANVKIIEELKYFLRTVCSEPTIRKLVTLSEKDFTRERKLTIDRIASLIINLPKRSLSIELQEFFGCLDQDIAPSTKGAFSLQRTKLKPLFFELWNRCLVDCFYHYYGDRIKRWRGFRLQAADGSTAYLINRKEVIEHFGAQDNQYVSVPMARVMQIQDILNEITIWGGICPIKQSEMSIMAGCVSHLYPDSITLFDRGYPSYALIYLMCNQETARRFVMRCKVGFNTEVRQFMHGKKHSQIVKLRPNAKAIITLREQGYIVTCETTITVRMVKVKLKSGEVEVLLTNLYDPREFNTEDLKYLYGLRWGIETTYGKQKNQQQMEQFSGHRVICIQQDYAAGLFVANLQSLIENQCEDYLQKINTKRKYEYKINRNTSWAYLKNNIVKLFLHNEAEQLLLKIQKAFERNIEPERPGRHYPRIVKTKRLNGKYQTFTNYRRAI